MSRVNIRTWYERVNDAWGDAPIAKPTDEEAAAGARRLLRFATGRTFRGEVVITSGNRYSYVRGGVLYVNAGRGWKGEAGIIHSLSHYAHGVVSPGIRPHGAAHARLEMRMIKAALARGYARPLTITARVERRLAALKGRATAIELAVELGVSYRTINGAALQLIRKGRARWSGRTLTLEAQP